MFAPLLKLGPTQFFLAALAWLPYLYLIMQYPRVATFTHVYRGVNDGWVEGKKWIVWATNLELGYQVVRVTADTIVHLLFRIERYGAAAVVLCAF